MANITKEQLKNEVHEILENADLSEISAKKVRERIETKFNCCLISRKKELDDLVMDFVNEHGKKDSDSDEEDNESEEESKVNLKRGAPKVKNQSAKKTKAEIKSTIDSDNSDDSPKKSTRSSRSDNSRKSKKVKKIKSKATIGEDGEEPKKKKRAGTGFTRPYTLSPDLAQLMGAESLPRHEVVKKMWQLIKDRNLYDPKNKQFAICDPELLKIMGVKRFRTFGMLKYLRTHFLD